MRMQGEGPTARGQPKQRQKILQKVEEKYAGFGPTLAAGASGPGRPARRKPGDIAALDAQRRTVEEGAPAPTASQKARAAGALRVVGADGRQLS
jgi:hypothetical protein